jgi:hypothetical protein
VPADDSFRCDDQESLFPSRPDPLSDYPEEHIEGSEPRARMSTLQRDELLTQSEILEKETLPSAKEADQNNSGAPARLSVAFQAVLTVEICWSGK